MQDNLDSAKEFIRHVKNHCVPNEGAIDNDAIEKITNYSFRHFRRIFNEYCKFTPYEYAERIRLLKCVEYIQKGNTLKNAAIQFGYSPEGLSNAIKVNLDLSVEKIRKEDFVLKKDIMISSMWKRLGEFKLQYNQDKFFSLMDGLHNEKVLKCIHADDLSDENAACDWFDIVLDYKKVKKILYEVDGCLIDKKVYEDFSVSDNAILHFLMQKARGSGLTKLSLRNDELLKYYFIVGFFYNTESPELVDGKYIFKLDDGIREIFASLNEIEAVTNETYDMTLHATMKNNKITLELGTAYKEALLVWNSMN